MNKYYYELTALGLGWYYILSNIAILAIICDIFHNIKQLQKKMDCCSKATRIDIWLGDNESELAEVSTD